VEEKVSKYTNTKVSSSCASAWCMQALEPFLRARTFGMHPVAGAETAIGKVHSDNPDAWVADFKSGQADFRGGAAFQEVSSPPGHSGHTATKVLVSICPRQPR
jgi:hypothetical protein